MVVQEGRSRDVSGVLPAAVERGQRRGHRRHRRVLGPFGRRGSDAERTPEIRGSPLLLRAGYVREGADREEKREELSPL